MKNKKFLGAVLTLLMVLEISGAAVTAKAASGQFDNALPTIQKQAYSSKKFTAKPLVILMDFPDYKHTDLDTKEKDFRINNFTGEETTPEFYEKLFFGDDTYKTSDGKEHITVNKFFKEESGGTYEFKGRVFGWYTADHEAAYYGGGDDQAGSAKLVKEAIQKLIQNNPDLDLSQFDVEDKWDINHNENYDEPDGIIDSIIVIHAGLGEEWGGGSLGKDAIWPFRIGFSWYSHDIDFKNAGEKLKEKDDRGEYPAYEFKDKNDKEWFAEDFAVFEQDLPVDLFDHEFGHVLGLPDLYSGQSTPPVQNWSIMGGSYTGDPRGSEPVSYGAYCRQFLQQDFEKRHRAANWQNSKVLNLEDIDEKGIDVVLDQASLKGENNDCIRINLPKREYRMAMPAEGNYCYFSGKGNRLENWMRSKELLDLTDKQNIKLTFKTWYNLDPGFDFVSLMVREDGSNKWVPVKGNITTTEVDQWIKDNEKPDEWLIRDPGHAISFASKDVAGADKNGWVDAEFDLSQFKGKKVQLGFRLKTDTNTPEDGMYIDDLKVTANNNVIFEDNAEGESKFDFEGFSKSDCVDRENQYYMLEWRNSKNGLVDKGLKTINIGYPGLQYDPGLTVWYINENYAKDGPGGIDQNVAAHPGGLFAGVVDADQTPVTYQYEDQASPKPDRIFYQMHDATFSLRPSSPVKIEGSYNGKKYVVLDDHTFMNPEFNDADDYTASNVNKQYGLSLVNYGLRVYVTDESKDRSTAKIHIARYTNGSKCAKQDDSVIKNIKVEDNKLYVQTDDEYGDKAYVRYVGKDNAKQEVVLNLKDGKYEGNADFLKDEDANWQIDCIILIDEDGNAKAIYNKQVHKIFGTNLVQNEAGKISVIKPDFSLPQGVTDRASLVVFYYKNGQIADFKNVQADVNRRGELVLDYSIVVPKEEGMTVKVYAWDSFGNFLVPLTK